MQGPNGDLWSILFQLIDERSGVTDFIKVKSHLEDSVPSVIKQNRIAFHHMLANSLADVVAEEAAKRLLPDLNLERKAKWTEHVGVGVAKRLALVQADIWAKRSEAGDIYELDPLLVEETTCTRTAFSTLVDELAHQGRLLVRHNKGLRCKVCNVYRAYKQFRFGSSHPCVPRPNAAAVISQFQNKKRQLINTSAGNSCHVLDQSAERNKISSKHDEKELYHCTSLGYRDIQSTHSHPEHFPLPVSLEPELDLAHTHQWCDYSLSQAVEQSGESHHVLTKLDGYGMEGKRWRIASFADDPEAFSEEECSQQDVVQRMVHVAGRPIIMCGTSGCSGSCSLSAVENGYEAGKKPATCQTCGKILPRPNVTLPNTSPAMSRRSSVVSWSDSPRDQAVPKSVGAVMEDCTESHQTWNEVLGEQSRSQVETALPAAMGPCAPSEPVLPFSGFVATSEHAVISGCVETRVECTVSHGFGKSGGKGHNTNVSCTPRHAVCTVISGFSAESSAAVQGKSCVDRAVSHGFDVAMSGGSCGKGTSLAHLARSQPGVGTQYILELKWCLEPRTSAGRNVTSRRSSANPRRSKKAHRDAKRKFVAQPEISQEAAGLILRNQAARTDEKFLVPYTSATISPCCMGTRTCFSVHSVVPSTLVEL